MANLVEGARALRQVLLSDPYRPVYHFVAPEGVCAPFDPNGALFWKGRYHLMYIMQTEKGHCWAHVSSKDLVHWRHHPMALEPGGVDRGIFSGGAFVDKSGTPTITYWGLGEDAGICIATSTDDELNQWTKSPHNPVIRQTSFGLALTEDGRPYGVADPSAIWIHNERYYMVTGNLLVLRKFGLEAGLDEHKGDTAYLIVSDDLVHWEYLHPFYQSQRRWTRADEDCMCPDFFALGDRHMLLFISHNLGCQYYLGSYQDDRFIPETHGRMTWVDNAFFAPESLLDNQGRRIMWAWVRDGRASATEESSMWSGMLSLPRQLSLGDDGKLCIGVPEELSLLRMSPRGMRDIVINDSQDVLLKEIRGNTLELALQVSLEGSAEFGVRVCCSPNGEEQTVVSYDGTSQRLKIDTTRSSFGEGPKSVESAPLELRPGELLELRVFVDRSVVEVFANGRQALVRTIYPTLAESLGVTLFSLGGRCRLQTLDAWDMAPANPW